MRYFKMSRSERLYNQVKQFRKYVIERSAALDEEEADLQDMKGSERYNKVSARIQSDRAQLMKEAREKFAPETDVLLHAMRQAADFKTTAAAPSEEALRLLQAFKLRLELDENAAISRDELQGAVAVMGDSETAFKALRQIAQKCGVIVTPQNSDKMTSLQAKEAVESLARNISASYHLPTVGNRKAWGDMMSGAQQSPFTTNTDSIRAWRIDVEPTSAADLIQSYTMLNDNAVSQFMEIIDSE